LERIKKSTTKSKELPPETPVAIVLLSGGLDSVLSLKIVLSQGVKVKGLSFITPFLKEQKIVREQAEGFEIPLVTIRLGEDYLNLVKRPKYGYGKHLNPCIDCRILMFKKAKVLLQGKSSFIVTGEVLAQRPSSQYKNALLLIEKEAGLVGRVLRPLSAKVLPETIPEKQGLINREKLLAISGRSRKEQLKLAKNFGIKNYLSPAGGCLLTEKEFSLKLKDLFEHRKKVEVSDLDLLKVGRHFRLSPDTKLIVGRNERENNLLFSLAGNNDFLLEVNGIVGPAGILQSRSKDLIPLAAGIVARYSDAKDFPSVPVNYWNKNSKRKINVKPIKDSKVKELRINCKDYHEDTKARKDINCSNHDILAN